MNSVRFAIVILTAGLLAAAPDDKDKKDAEAIKGTWALTAMTAGGQTAPEEVVKPVGAKFEDKAYSQLVGGKAVEEGTFKIDPEKSPKTIEFVIEKGPDAGKTQLGIYELDGDTMKFCVTPAGNAERPKTFDAKAGSDQVLFVWKRVKS